MSVEQDISKDYSDWQDRLQQIMQELFTQKQQAVAEPQPIPPMIVKDLEAGNLNPKDWHYHNQMSIHFLGRGPDLVEMAVMDTEELSVDPDFNLPSPKCLVVSAAAHLHLIAKIFDISIEESLEVLVEFVSLTSARHVEGFGAEGTKEISESLQQEDQQKDRTDDDDECVDWIDR